MSERDHRFEAVRDADDGWVNFIAGDGHMSIGQRGPRSYDKRLLDILKAADEADEKRGIRRVDMHPEPCTCGHRWHEHVIGGEFEGCGHEVTPPKRGRTYGEFCDCNAWTEALA